MSPSPSEWVARLRCAVGSDSADTNVLYEHWLRYECWALTSVAVPLVVGIDPAHWPGYVAQHGLAVEAAALGVVLAADLGLTPVDEVAVMRLAAWALRAGVVLPEICERTLDFIARTLPARAPVAMPSSVENDERVAILGAALALATRFTEQCLDAERRFDSQRMVALLRAQSAIWFGAEPPRMDDAAIADLLDRYLRLG